MISAVVEGEGIIRKIAHNVGLAALMMVTFLCAAQTVLAEEPQPGNHTAGIIRAATNNTLPTVEEPQPGNHTAGMPDVLRGAQGTAAFSVGDERYVVAAVPYLDALRIINVTDPLKPEIVSTLVDDRTTYLDGASGVDVYRAAGSTYAVVASRMDDAIQIVDVTDPTNPVPVSDLADDDTLSLGGAYDVDVYAADGRIYAAVAAAYDDGVQIIDVTDPGSSRKNGG